MKKEEGKGNNLGLLVFTFNENELINYLDDFKNRCDSGQIESREDISDFVMR